jgi:hypothetical protein
MNDRKAALIARICELLEARRAELRAIAELEVLRPRVRILRTMACLLLMASAASAAPMRQLPPPKPSCRPATIIIVPVYRAPRPIVYYNLDAQAKPRVFVDNVEETNLPTINRRGVNEVPSPNIVRESSRRHMTSILLFSSSSRFSSFSRHFQSRGLPETIHAFVVDHFAVATKQRADSAIAKPGTLPNKFEYLLCQPLVFVFGSPCISLT